MPSEIQFLFNSGMTLTFFSNLSFLSYILILIDPNPTILHSLLFQRRTMPPFNNSRSSNHCFLGDIWKEHPESITHPDIESMLEATSA